MSKASASGLDPEAVHERGYRDRHEDAILANEELTWVVMVSPPSREVFSHVDEFLLGLPAI